MRTSIIKINPIVGLMLVFLIGPVGASSSRIDCLEKIGNNATRVQLDACVNGDSVQAPKSKQVITQNLSPEESTCLELGFKRKTEPYGNCVLELMDRKLIASEPVSTDQDDITCRKYGFKPNTPDYGQCRLQIDTAKSQARQQAEQYAQQQRQYKAQLDEQQRQRSVAAGMALFQLGTGITSGAYNSSNSYGAKPNPPTMPNPHRQFFLPGGKTMNCTTTGTVTNCF
jgi:hypothetical protein